MTDAQLQHICAVLGWQGGTFDQVLAEVARLHAHVATSGTGLNLPAGASPADIATQRAAVEAFAVATNWSPLR